MSKVQSSVLSKLPTSRDLLVKAKTGTGKTLAFLVAALESLMALPDKENIKMNGKIGCVIIAPTRELALQISEEAGKLLGPLGWGVQHLVGGYSKGEQLDRISKEPAEFIVATPGRMKDLLGNNEFMAKIKESKIVRHDCDGLVFNIRLNYFCLLTWNWFFLLCFNSSCWMKQIQFCSWDSGRNWTPFWKQCPRIAKRFSSPQLSTPRWTRF